jgi:RNA polymerase sigma factor (sigma-70 family)
MSEPARDTDSIAPDDPETRLLHRYRRARVRGDDEGAIEAWDELVLRHYDLMRTKIARLASRGDFRWIGHAEIDDVAQEAYLRAAGMALRFEGENVGQLRAALITTAEHTARDQQRRLDVRNRRVAGSLDEARAHDDGGEYHPWDAKAAGTADWTSEHALGRIGGRRIVDAIGRLRSDNQRAVINLTWSGHDSKTIAARLQMTVANVDQLRHRGLAKLKELLDDDGQH